jgi:hypothetical protein
MGFIKIGSDALEMKVYLTELGRKRLLEQGFKPVSFSIADEDVNYNANLNVEQMAPDVTGDYNDNVFSLSKHVKINSNIIK